MAASYEQLRREVTWDLAKRELGYRDGEPINIAWLCVDRHVEAGQGERAWCRRRRRPAEGHAMVYAAKEALFKALGTGKVGRMAWHDIELAWPDGAREPAMTLAGETAEAAASMGVAGVHVAVTTTGEHAAAWVVVTGADARRESVVSSQ